jgi:hypothetical protein
MEGGLLSQGSLLEVENVGFFLVEPEGFMQFYVQL